MKKNRSIRLFLLAYFLISLFVFRNLLLSKGFIGMRDDWVMPFFSGQYIGQAKKILYSWSSNFIGMNYIRRFGDYPYLIFGFLASIFGFGGAFFTKAILVLTLTLSGFSCFLLLRNFRMKNMSAFVGSLLYMLSPMFYNATVSGYFVFLISYSLLPLFLLLFRQIIGYEGRVPLSKIFVSGIVLRLIIGQDNFLFIAPVLIGLFYIFEIIYKKKKLGDIIIDIRNFLPVVLVAVLLSLTSFINIFTSSDESFGLVSKGLESWNVGAAPTFFHSFFLDGAGYKYFLLSIPNGAVIIWLIFGVIVLMLIFSSLLFIKKDIYLIFFSLLSLCFIFLFKGGNPPFSFVYRFLFESIPLMKVAFRNIQYLTIFVSLGYAYMLGRVLDVVSDNSKIQGSAYSVILGHIVLIIMVFALPFMTGGLAGNVQTIKFDKSYKYLLEKVEKDSSDARTLWLPISQPITYKGKVTPGLDSFFVGSSKGFVMNDGAGSLDRILSEEMYTTKNPESIKNLLALLNIEKVILRNDFYSHHPDFMDSKFWRKNNLLWNSKTLRENTEKISSLVLLEESGPVKIYKNNFFAPHFYAANKYVGINGNLVDFTKVAEVGSYSPLTSYKFIGEESDGEFDDIYYLPISVSDNLPSAEYLGRTGIKEDSWVWPDCSVSPADAIYKGVLLKEQVSTFGKEGLKDRFENSIWLSAKRVCEVDTYYDSLSSEEIESLLKSFLEGFERSYSVILDVRKNPSGDYVNFARKADFYYEKSLSILVKKIPEIIQREDVKSLYWKLYSLSLADFREVDNRDFSFNYSFLITKPGSYDLYSDLNINGEVNILDSSGISIGSTEMLESSENSSWEKIYSGLDISKTGSMEIIITSQKKENLAEIKEEGTDSDIVMVITGWEPRSDYLITFDYAFGSGDFIVSFREKIPQVGYYRYGDGIFDWFDFADSDISWVDSEILYREFKNSLDFDKTNLDALGVCVYWEGDVCYRRFSALISSNALSKEPLFYIKPIINSELDSYKSNIKNIQILKVSRPNLVLTDFREDVVLSGEETPIISHEKVNQSKYLVTIQPFERDFRLVFSEGFNKKWKVYLKEGDSKKTVFSGLLETIISDPKPFETLGKKPLFADSHEKVNDYANSWIIDKKILESVESPVTLIVEFSPQKAHYIWVFVSFATFVGISLYFIKLGVREIYGGK